MKITSLLPVSLILGLIIVAYACNKEKNDSSYKSDKEKFQEDEFQTSESEDPLIFADLVHFLDGDSSSLTQITQLGEVNLEYSYFNEEENPNNLYYFTTLSQFENFLTGKSIESEVLAMIQKADSLSNTGDENDTTEYFGFVLNPEENENIRNRDRRLPSLGAVGWDWGNCGGSSTYCNGWRRNLGSMDQKISAVTYIGFGLTNWFHGKNFTGHSRISYT